MESELQRMRQRVSVLTAKRREARLSDVEDVELEMLTRLLREHDAGYAPIAA